MRILKKIICTSDYICDEDLTVTGNIDIDENLIVKGVLNCQGNIKVKGLIVAEKIICPGSIGVQGIYTKELHSEGVHAQKLYVKGNSYPGNVEVDRYYFCGGNNDSGKIKAGNVCIDGNCTCEGISATRNIFIGGRLKLVPSCSIRIGKE